MLDLDFLISLILVIGVFAWGSWLSFLWPKPIDLKVVKIEDRVKRVQETLWRIDRRIDHMAEDLTKIRAAETHIIANFDALLVKLTELADRLANIKVDDPQTQIDIDAIASELEAEAAKADPATPAPVVP